MLIMLQSWLREPERVIDTKMLVEAADVVVVCILSPNSLIALASFSELNCVGIKTFFRILGGSVWLFLSVKLLSPI